MSARVICLGEKPLIFLLSRPQSITHGCDDVIVIPGLDHEVSYICHIVQSAENVRCREQQHVS